MKHECLKKWRYVVFVREWNDILRQSKIYVTLVIRFLRKEQWYNLSIIGNEQRLNDMEGQTQMYIGTKILHLFASSYCHPFV